MKIFKILAIALIVMISANAYGLPDEYYKIKDTKQMKKYFFNYIKTISDVQKNDILNDRKFVTEFYSKKDTADKTSDEYKRFKAIQKRYKRKDKDSLDEYLKYIDVIPTSLVVAQAVLESGWGKSRFVKKANNIFGQWTYSEKGIKPLTRNKGAKHLIKIFDSMEHSVRGYMINMNLGWGYKGLRDQRAKIRKAGENVTGLSIVDQLVNYSQGREKYTKKLAKLIKRNKLYLYDEVAITKAAK
jgi:Bax protein